LQQWLTQDRPVANVGSAVVSVVAGAVAVVAAAAVAAPVVVVARTRRKVRQRFTRLLGEMAKPSV
jgi:hypothetical protein